MKTNEILELNFKKEENRQIIQKVLRKIKPLANYDISEDIPLNVLEKLIAKYEYKYDHRISVITCNSYEGEMVNYTANISISNYSKIKPIHGCCIYELFAKIVILYYSLARKEN